MKSKNSAANAIRAPGQRSISSTLLFRPTTTTQNHKCSIKTSCEEGSDAPLECGKKRSLSAFLNRKLHSTSVLPIDKEKTSLNHSEVREEKVSLPVNQDRPNQSIFRDDLHGSDEPCADQKPVIEDSVFKLFNGTQGEKLRKTSSDGLSCSRLTAPSRSESVVKKHARNNLVVLGDDPKPKRRAYGKYSNKKERPFYNHYENGTGWWDYEREGVDNDEVGAQEVWEGMGSTTLGGLDWH